MQTGEFVAAFREAFGPVPELPLLFRYTDEPLRPAAKAGGCFFKALAEARDGRPVGLNASNIGCGGGKFYTGFSPMPEFVPQFVSLKERYKQTPEMVLDFIAALDLRPGPKAWLEFVRVDAAGTFDGAEGVLFFATPDVLAGLVTWAGFDNDAPDADAIAGDCTRRVRISIPSSFSLRTVIRRIACSSGSFSARSRTAGMNGCLSKKKDFYCLKAKPL